MANLKELGYDLYGLPGKQIKLTKEETETENVLGSMLPTEPSTGNTQILSKPGVSIEDKVEKDGTIMPDKVENGSADPETMEDSDEGTDDIEISDSDMEPEGPIEKEGVDVHPAGMPQPPDPPEGQIVKDEVTKLESVVENARVMAERFSGTPMYPKYLHVYNEAVNNLNAFKGINRSFFEAPGDENDNPEEPTPNPGEEGDEPSPDDGGEAPTEEPTDDASAEPESDTGDDSSEENLDDINVANGEGDIADDSPENPDAGADPNAVDTETEPPKDPKDPEVDLNDYKNGIRAKTFQKSLDNAKERMERATDPELKKRYKAEYDSIKENFELYKKKNDNSQELSADSYEDMTEDAKRMYTESVIDIIEGGTAMGYFDDMTELFKESSIYGEAANISPEMKPIIEKLNKKGYKTKYSSPGYEKERSKSDHEPDGVKNGKLYSTARLMFDGDYNLPPAPDGWEWRQVEKNDYLDVKEKSFDKSEGGDPDEAFKKWKSDYMTALTKWVDDLPDAGTNNGDSSRNPDADSDHTEVRESTSIFDFGDNMLNDFLEETSDDFALEDMYVSETADDSKTTPKKPTKAVITQKVKSAYNSLIKDAWDQLRSMDDGFKSKVTLAKFKTLVKPAAALHINEESDGSLYISQSYKFDLSGIDGVDIRCHGFDIVGSWMYLPKLNKWDFDFDLDFSD